MTVMALSLLFIYVKYYLYLDSFCLLCKTICMPQVGPNWKLRYCIVYIVLHCIANWVLKLKIKMSQCCIILNNIFKTLPVMMEASTGNLNPLD